MKQRIINILDENQIINRKLTELTPEIEEAAQLLITTFKNKNKILLFGNGGSAADAQHIASEFVVRFYKNREAIPAIALTNDSSVITSSSNDYGYSQVFKRQIQALASDGDCVIAISTSGQSKNVIEAAKEAKNKECALISLIGAKQSELQSLSDITISIPSEDTPRIQEAHITISHIICELVEKTLFSE